MSGRYRTTVAGGLVIKPASADLTEHAMVALNSAKRGERAYIRHGDTFEYVVAIDWIGNAYHLTLTRGGQMVQFDNPLNLVPPWVGQLNEILRRITTTGDITPCQQSS